MGKTFQFGSEGRLVGLIIPPGTGASCGTGVVAWGLGLAELKVAKRLSSLGLVSMQVGRRDDRGESTRGEPTRLIGVELCRESISELKRREGVTSFILLGTCARASLCLNAALDEAGVIGLILVNPNISDKLSFWPMIRSRASSWTSWRNVITGRTKIGPYLRKLFLIIHAAIFKSNPKRRDLDPVALVGDTTLPVNLDDALNSLSERGVKLLVICSENDPSLYFFRNNYGRDLSGLKSDPNISIEVLATAPHVFSEDQEVTARFENIVFHWAQRENIVPPTN
jgi:hypothetical protein